MLPRGSTITESPGLYQAARSGKIWARFGKSVGMSLPRIAQPLPSTQHRPSAAMWRIDEIHVSPSSHVGAMYISHPCANSANLGSGM